MKKMTFVQKLWLPFVISLLVFVFISVLNAYALREAHFSERKLALKNLGESALSIVRGYGELEKAGTLTLAEAQSQALDRIRSIRYGTDGYFAILGADERMLMHPINPKLVGQKVEAKDLLGGSLFGSISNSAKEPGGGFTDYRWPRTGSAEPVLKTSYATIYQPWEWRMFTGVYVDDIDAAFRHALYKAAGMLAVFGAILVAITSLINRDIQRLLGGDPAYATEIANRISRNDLTLNINVKKGDERSLVYAMKKMRDSLSATVGNIQGAAQIIDNAAREIASGNLDLSARTEGQAGSLEQTASAMEQLTSTVNHNADNAQQANQLANAASDIAAKGGDVVKNVINTMGSINDSSKKIVDIISVIDGIAFQTNILALNAAVEAARAGQEGRGFAVVAAEVRSLAQRSSDAAKEIKVLIDDSVTQVAMGTRLVSDAGATMASILASVENVAQIVNEISVASREQSVGIAEIGRAVSQMDTTTQQNAAQVEEVAAASQLMQDQAAQLAALVGRFKLSEVSRYDLIE
jgi:methyl-accepting chemotaxis protein